MKRGNGYLVQSIGEKIQQRRLQILIHSCLYYELDNSIISDATWNKWAKELIQLQKDNPEVSKQIKYYNEFKDFDGSTGFNLPIKDSWVIGTAKYLLKIHDNVPQTKPKTVSLI